MAMRAADLLGSHIVANADVNGLTPPERRM